jgi:hypothetical protein
MSLNSLPPGRRPEPERYGRLTFSFFFFLCLISFHSYFFGLEIGAENSTEREKKLKSGRIYLTCFLIILVMCGFFPFSS